MTQRPILVTGGAGFLGSALVRRLAAEGRRVRVLDDQSRGSYGRLGGLTGDVEIVHGDIRDAAAVQRAVQGVETVCHLAFVNGTEFFYSMPEVVLEVGVKGIVNVIDACLDNGVRNMLLMSSSEVYQTPPSIPTDESVPLSVPDPLNPRFSYGGSKIISELMALNYGRHHFDRVVIVRPHNVYGPDMGNEHVVPQFFAQMIRLLPQRHDPLLFTVQGDGSEQRAFVYIDDFIDGTMAVLDRGEHLGIYHVGTMEEIAMRDLAHLVAAQFGRTIRIEAGAPAPGGTARRCPDIGKVAALGYQPKWTLADGIAAVADWHRQQLAAAGAPARPVTFARHQGART